MARKFTWSDGRTTWSARYAIILGAAFEANAALGHDLRQNRTTMRENASASARRRLFTHAPSVGTPPTSCVANDNCYRLGMHCPDPSRCSADSAACKCLRSWMRTAAAIRPHFLNDFCGAVHGKECARKVERIETCSARHERGTDMICTPHILNEPPGGWRASALHPRRWGQGGGVGWTSHLGDAGARRWHWDRSKTS